MQWHIHVPSLSHEIRIDSIYPQVGYFSVLSRALPFPLVWQTHRTKHIKKKKNANVYTRTHTRTYDNSVVLTQISFNVYIEEWYCNKRFESLTKREKKNRRTFTLIEVRRTLFVNFHGNKGSLASIRESSNIYDTIYEISGNCVYTL